jgi:hypothetical protein
MHACVFLLLLDLFIIIAPTGGMADVLFVGFSLEEKKK